MDRVRVGVLLCLLLICLSSVIACLYLLWQMVTQSETRGQKRILLAFGAAPVPEVLVVARAVPLSVAQQPAQGSNSTTDAQL
ncbi:hypothetical protein [Deinococcus sp.]|uniref:hypothetical protein n=1 Tax=Deinococcus sp. TaxID=47478 RepID=UPI00391B4081